ncbi:MAG: hypothetical protein JO342_19730, partial [Solirubrobacterales bacterium]|nr:hypothetical protein [Solirubrobacterales bacterium]
MAEEDPRSQADDNGDETKEQNGGNGDRSISGSVIEEIRSVVRDAAMEVLGPAARQ